MRYTICLVVVGCLMACHGNRHIVKEPADQSVPVRTAKDIAGTYNWKVVCVVRNNGNPLPDTMFAIKYLTDSMVRLGAMKFAHGYCGGGKNQFGNYECQEHVFHPVIPDESGRSIVLTFDYSSVTLIEKGGDSMTVYTTPFKKLNVGKK